MADYCQHCGAVIDTEAPVERFGVRLHGVMLTHNGSERRLTGLEAKMMRILIMRHRVTHEAVLLAMDSTCEDEINLYRSKLSRLRHRLAEQVPGVIIRNIWGWGLELALLEPQEIAA